MKLYKILKSSRGAEDINMEELKTLVKTNIEALLLDVRSPQEYKEGHLNRSN